MTSKEAIKIAKKALIRLEDTLDSLEQVDVINNLTYTHDINIIYEELTRLEELEKAFVALSKEDEKTKKLLSLEIEKNRELQIIKEKINEMVSLIQKSEK